MAAVTNAKTAGAGFTGKIETLEVTYDFDNDAGATGALDLLTADSNCMVRVAAKVKTACTSGGSATLEVGKSGATATAIAQSALTTINAAGKILQPVGWMYLASAEKLIQTIATAALTAGKITYLIEIVKF
jgi:hypothetical protein